METRARSKTIASFVVLAMVVSMQWWMVASNAKMLVISGMSLTILVVIFLIALDVLKPPGVSQTMQPKSPQGPEKGPEKRVGEGP